MGVLACDRRGCERIMCDNYSHTHGYLCYDCKQELVETGGSVSIYEFMNGEKDVQGVANWEAIVEDEFVERD